jgi:hypothetical protein
MIIVSDGRERLGQRLWPVWGLTLGAWRELLGPDFG